MKLSAPYYKRHADDEWFDEIRIELVPRYKTSGLSGDEWRVSAVITMLRKGHVQIEKTVSDMAAATAFLPGLFIERGFPAGADEGTEKPDMPVWCGQPGCPNRATSIYRIKKQYSKHGEEIVDPLGDLREVRRAFCGRHLQRGDCGLEDSDMNYAIVSGPGPDKTKMLPSDESPSVFGGFVDVPIE